MGHLVRMALATALGMTSIAAMAGGAFAQSDLETFITEGGRALSVEETVEIFTDTTFFAEGTTPFGGMPAFYNHADGNRDAKGLPGFLTFRWWVNDEGEFCANSPIGDNCGGVWAVKDDGKIIAFFGKGDGDASSLNPMRVERGNQLPDS